MATKVWRLLLWFERHVWDVALAWLLIGTPLLYWVYSYLASARGV